MAAPRRVFALIRHGDYHQQQGAPSAHQPHGLSELGRQQARAAQTEINAFSQLQHLSLAKRHYCSTLRRAWETLTELLTALNVSESPTHIEATDALTERSVGAMANLTAHQIEQLISDDPRFAAPPANWKSDSHYQLPVPGAESLMEAGLRVAHFLSDQSQQPCQHDELILVVGHGASIRHAAHHLGILAFDEIATLSMYHATPVFVEQRADKQWQLIGGAWKVRSPKTEFTD